MSLRRLSRALVAGSLALAAVGLAAGPAASAPAPGQGTPVTVMTRNLYLGGDIGRPLRAVLSLPPGSSATQQLVALANANDTLRGIVDATNFPARSKRLAQEIATNEPDLVGLQEVAKWRHGPMETPPDPDFGTPNAQTVDYDFLATLTADLAALGEPYTAVSVQEESDVEAPAFAGNPLLGQAITNPRDVRLTMRDVILKRVDSGVKVEASGSAQYATRLTVPIGPGFTFIRGYNWADVHKGTKHFRFVNTHLESEFSYLAAGQAQELLAGPAAVTDRPVILVCDCNSDPLDGSRKTLPNGALDVPHWTAYRIITGAGHFTDGWLQVSTAEQGWTSGLSELVNDTPAQAAARFDHRIDMVFLRPAAGGAITAVSGTVTGKDPALRTPGGLWPSDHAGVVLRVRP